MSEALPSMEEKVDVVSIKVFGLFRGIYGVEWPDEKILEFDPNDFDMDPSMFYELLQEEYGVEYDDGASYFGGYGGRVADTVQFIAKNWDGETSESDVMNIQDGMGVSLLHLACQDDSVAKVKALLESNVEIDITDNAGRTPMHEAIAYENMNVLALLISSGANIEYKDTQYGATYLHHALQEPNRGVIELLINAGVPIDQPDEEGWTPLWFALEKLEIASILLSRGANPNKKNPEGMTLLAFAMENDDKRIQALLLEYGAVR